MTVYVDPLMGHGWKRLGHSAQNCHLFTDAGVEVLHTFAERIGIKRKWFQDKRIPHYELAPFRRRVAVACGAVDVDLREAVDLWARIQGRARALTREESER
jgi:hypothetical protein